MIFTFSLNEALAAWLKVGLTVCLFFVTGSTLEAQSPANATGPVFIERIDLIGNLRVKTSSIRAVLQSRAGEVYNVEKARRDVETLRSSGSFSDVRLDVEDSVDQPNAKILVFYLNEKPIIRRIEFRGTRSVSTSDVMSALRAKHVDLTVGSLFDQAKLARATTAIKELLLARGYASATVDADHEKLPGFHTVSVTFNINEGPRSR